MSPGPGRPLPETGAGRDATMAQQKQTAPLQISTRWVRPAVAIGKGETHLVVTLTTARPETRSERPPVDIAFVVDRSGSMSGAPLELAKQGVIGALDGLNDADTF